MTDEYETIPREDIVLIDKYFNWKKAKAEGKDCGDTLKEWCGIPESKLVHKYVVNYYNDFYVEKTMYHEYMGEVEVYSVFDQLARIVKANQIFNWFINNVMSGVANNDYYEVTKEHLENLLKICNKVKNSFTNNDGEYIVNAEVAEENLPLMKERGIFFGTSTYDNNYATHVIEMVNIIDNILSTIDFEKETVYFNAIW
jgi:hypothetical protein